MPRSKKVNLSLVLLVAAVGAALGQLLSPNPASACTCGADEVGRWDLSLVSVETLEGRRDHAPIWNGDYRLNYSDGDWFLYAAGARIEFRNGVCR